MKRQWWSIPSMQAPQVLHSSSMPRQQSAEAVQNLCVPWHGPLLRQLFNVCRVSRPAVVRICRLGRLASGAVGVALNKEE